MGKTGLDQQFWVCAETADSRFEAVCDDLEVDGAYEPKSELMLKLQTPAGRHEYGLRHGIPTDECFLMLAEIQRLLEDSRTFCLAGAFAGSESEAINGQYDWVFFEFLSDNGSVCDFCEWRSAHE
jgi:hypothetical protein